MEFARTNGLLTQLGEAIRLGSVQACALMKLGGCNGRATDPAAPPGSSNMGKTFMRFQPKTLLVAALLALAASPTLAQVASPTPVRRAAPGPIAGAGLGFLVLAGGYYVVRRWRNRNTEE